MTKTGSFFFLFDMLSFCFSFLLPFHFFVFCPFSHLYCLYFSVHRGFLSSLPNLFETKSIGCCYCCAKNYMTD
jgi:hypothetical protein